MAIYEPAAAQCHVLTFKEGLLSKIAHDLRIEVSRFRVEVDDESRAIEASFEPTSLRVVCARKDGRDAPGTLSAGDKRKIEANIQKDVLETRRHGEIRFRSTAVEPDGDDAHRVTGELSLHGRTREVRARIRRDGDAWVTSVRLHQPDFGITPYSAMMGTLKVQPTVEVELRVPAGD